jgi:cell wall assembly regulator SMI1
MPKVDQVMQRLRHFVADRIEPNCQLEPATEERLQQFEHYVGYRLPPDYREFLRSYGGVSLTDHVVAPALDSRADPDADLFSISDFYGFYRAVSTGPCPYDLFQNYRTLKDALPAGMVPFGESGDNRFCISCSLRDYGRVYCLVPGQFSDDTDTLYLIANSFTEFMESLQILDD